MGDDSDEEEDGDKTEEKQLGVWPDIFRGRTSRLDGRICRKLDYDLDSGSLGIGLISLSRARSESVTDKSLTW